MRLIVSAPVADRAWALPAWFACLAEQTRQPDGFCFAHSGEVGDATWDALLAEAARHGFPVPAIHHSPTRPHARGDNNRFLTLTRLRNQLLAIARDGLGADLILSLDTDVMVNDPETIERLERLVTVGDCDIAAPVAFLHPGAPEYWTPGDEVCWAYNFGFLPSGPSGPRRPWQRPQPSELPWGQRIRMQIPMAVWLGNRRALSCQYSWHESGEDIGYAQALEIAGAECIVDTSLYARHIWSEQHLNQPAGVA